MIFVFMLLAMLLWPMGSPEKLFSQTGFDSGNRSSVNQAFSNPASWDAGRRVLDYQFDRADRELSPDRWMREARLGIMAVRSVLAEMVPDVFLDSQANAQFTEWTEQELENRFTRWLLEHFFGVAIEIPAFADFRETGEEASDFDNDLLFWREMAHNIIDRETQEYSTAIMEMYPELLMYISGDRKEKFTQKLAEAGELAIRSLKHEFEATLAREERYFNARRLGEMLRLTESGAGDDKSAAATIGAILIEEARQIGSEGIASIEARIEAAKADGVDLALAGNQWLEEYREQFNRGLQAWESAEERFLLRRIEWERSAELAFREGIDVWNAAFYRLDEERRNWEEEARRLLLEGEQFFVHVSETLASAIAAAKTEFERESRFRTAVASERAGALANMYLTSTSAADEARKNIDLWINKYREIRPNILIPAVDDEVFDEWVDNMHRLSSLTFHGLEKTILEELKSWLALYRSYSARAQENLEALAKEMYAISGVWDHYGTELLRLEAELEYWIHRTVTAEAVAAYSEAMEAGRISAAERLEAWEKARAAYDEAAGFYAGADDALKEGGAGLSSAMNAFAEAAEKMRVADAAIERLHQNYQLLFASIGIAGGGIIAEDLDFLHRQLDAEQVLMGSMGETSPWGKFFDLAIRLEAKQLEEIRKEVLRQLIAGDGEEFEPLANLARRAENIDLSKDDPFFILAEIFFAEEKISPEQYELFLSALLESSQSRAENELEIRLAAISLLIEKGSAGDWYYSVRGSGAAGSNGAAIPNIEALLFGEWERDRLELIRARAKLELEALDFIEGKDASDAAGWLASLYAGDETTILLDRKLLEQILIMSGENTFAEIRDERIQFFLSGGSFIDPLYGREMANVFLKDYVRREEFSESLYYMYVGSGDIAQAIIRENIKRGFRQLNHLWETLGIETDDFILPPAATIIKTLTELDGDASHGIPSLIFILDEIFYSFPHWLELPFGLWKQNLVEYFASSSEMVLVLSERHTDHLNAALRFMLDETQRSEATVFETEASWYQADPFLEFHESSFTPLDNMAHDDYENAIGELLNRYSRERNIMDEIDRLTSMLETLSRGLESAEHELESISSGIALAEETHAKYVAEYHEAADNFKRSGEVYDFLYAEAMQAFKNLDDARKAFEIQDNIRLWAETSYLDDNKPAEELAYCRERAARASEALTLLRSVSPDSNISEASDYKNAYISYQESLSLYTLSLDALYKLERAMEAEVEKNSAAYNSYQDQLSLFGKSLSIEEDYVSPEDKSLWGIADIITIDNNGFLVFALNGDNRLSGSDEARSEMLREYFAKNNIVNGEVYLVSSFELAMRELSAGLFGRNISGGEYRQLGLARDYLINEIIRTNAGVTVIQEWYNTAKDLRGNSNLSSMPVVGDHSSVSKVSDILPHFHRNATANAQRNAWNSLDQDTKKALEFYTILTLLDGGGANSKYFSHMTEFLEYDLTSNTVENIYRQAKKKASRPIIGGLYKGNEKKMRETRNAVFTPRNHLNSQIDRAHIGLTEALRLMNEKLNAYKESSESLALLKGEKNGIIRWEDMEEALADTEGFDVNLNSLRELWERANGSRKIVAYDVYEALELLVQASRNFKEEGSRHLHQVWQSGEMERAANEAAYRELFSAYLDGLADLKELRAAAVLSFGTGVVSGKEHLENIGNALIENIYMHAEFGLGGMSESSQLVWEYAGIINSAWKEKYAAELNIRINEWELQQRDIQEKFNQWQDTAGAIIWHGRTTWNESEKKMREAQNMWAKTFEEEYERISGGWTAAYLEGLKDKEAWAAAAFETAAHASSAAAVALVGSGAEAGARAFDTRDPTGFMNLPDAQEGERILSDLLTRAGTGFLSNAFGSIRNSGATFATVVRSGISGNGIWSSASAMTEAAALARTVREDFETRESQKMAFMVMNTSNDLLMELKENIRLANGQFRDQIDDTFIMGGQWWRSGTGYTKRVVVHSTLFNAAITERAEIEGYRNFVFTQTRLFAYTDEESLRNLNAFQAEALIDSLYSEINELFTKIFDGDTGEFPAHIGEAPKSLSDKGSGESGRLLSEFYHWMNLEFQGIAAMSVAPWDKPLWDSRDSSFNAPTVRSAVKLAVQTGITIAGVVAALPTAGSSIVGTIALNVALNSATDLVFTAMDLAGGYINWKEAGVEFGKTLLTNTVSAASGSVFNGVSGASSAFFGSGGISGLVTNKGLVGVAYKALTAGVNTLATGTINSAISSVSYDAGNGFKFSRKAFVQNFKGSAIGAISGTTGIFTSGLMDLGLTGFTENLFMDGQRLSNLTGGLASQGVNFAMGNDFTLNMFNAGIFSRSDVSAGILEMGFGRNGISFALGSGGADASIGTLVSAAKGLEAWKVNMELLFAENSNSRTYASVMRTLYSGSEVNRLEYENILAGRTVIEERRGSLWTQSTYDAASGIKTIYLGSHVLDDSSRFGLNVVISHESYRDGIDNGEAGQKRETYNSVVGNISTTIALQNTYGLDAVGDIMAKMSKDFIDAINNNDVAAIASIFGSFDSSADYWKLVKGDNNAWHWIDDKSADFDISDLLNDRDFQRRFGADKSNIIQAMFTSVQDDGKGFGIISAGRMTSDIANALGYAVVPTAISGGSNRGGLYFPSPLETTINQVRNSLIGDTLDKIAYNIAHTTTIYDKRGRPVSLHNIDEANLAQSELLRQTSPSLGGIDNMALSGCNFMVIISVPQLLTRQVLDAQQVTEIWNTAITNEIMKANGYVNNREALANLALQTLGITNFGIHLDGTTRKNASVVGYRVQVPYNNTGHFVLTGKNMSLIYNPARTFTSNQSLWKTVEISAYGK